MRRKVIYTITILLAASLSQAQEARFYFGYGDEATAALNGKQVGEEISTTVPLKVLSRQNFKVQVWTERLTGQSEALTNLLSMHIAYDRASASNFAPVPEANFLDRKLSFGGSSLLNSISNLVVLPLFDTDLQPLDLDDDGIQDTAPLNRQGVRLRGAFRSISNSQFVVRPVGLSGQQMAPDSISQIPQYWSMGVAGTKKRMYDFELSNALNPGESYGNLPTDTGLELTPSNANRLVTGTHCYYQSSNSPTGSSLGSRLVVQAVPEPASLLAIAVGGFALIRRKRQE